MRLLDHDVERAVRALEDCGYVYLERIFKPQHVRDIKVELAKLLKRREFRDVFSIPVAGEGREEFMLPFRPPFNNSILLQTHALRDIVLRFLGGEHVKIHLLSVVLSYPGSSEQGWHQDWRYLFNKDTKDPPYAVQVGIPLEDWSDDMGPTQFCPGSNDRFYNGKPCEMPIAAGSSVGDAVIWDYRVLHRGPANKNVFLLLIPNSATAA
eukprot:jgi/Bigna1/129154/aug1.8_g3862